MVPNAGEPRTGLKPVANGIDGLETPIPVMNMGVVENNLIRWQKRCDQIGLKNRPHAKTHKMTALAHQQIALGAAGITVQKLGEAEVMAEAGITDIFVTFNIVGRAKLNRLTALARTADIQVTADCPQVVYGLALAAADAGTPIGVLVECDTGGARTGVQSPDAAAQLALQVSSASHLDFRGIATFPPPGGRQKMGEFLTEARNRVINAGCACDCVSTGGTPDMWCDAGLETVTEYRAGTYIFNDQSVITSGACAEEDCAIDVLATIVSTPTPDRAILDAGSKSLTSDKLGEDGFGRVRGTEARLYAVTEEHGMLDTRSLPRKPQVGDRVRIIPNHICPVINLFDSIAIEEDHGVVRFATVDARGRVS